MVAVLGRLREDPAESGDELGARFYSVALVGHRCGSSGRLRMLVCYLDDSGEDHEPIITLAGVIGTAYSWQEFEVDARHLFDVAGIEHLHTVDLHHRRGQFKNWNSTETERFAHALFRLVEHHVGFVVEFSTLKSRFNARKKQLGLNREGSPMSMCFRGVLDVIVSDEGFLALVH